MRRPRSESPLTFVPIAGATNLFTFRDGDTVQAEALRDSIVRIIPGPDTTPEARAQFKALLDGIARHVWFAPAQGKRRAVPAVELARPRAASSVRSIVAELVAAARTADRDRLTQVVEGALANAGV